MKTNIYFDQHTEQLVAHTVSLSKVLLFGLDPSLSAGLLQALAPGGNLSGTSRDLAECMDVLRNEQIDVIFCSSKRQYCRPLLQQLRRLGLTTPVIVVSEEPEFEEWLDAMEAGAADYCAAPFEQSQLHFILASHLAGASLAA